MACNICNCNTTAERYRHTPCDRIIVLWSILLLMFDVYSDWVLVLTYIFDGDLGWAGLTTMFIAVPTLMYMLDGFLIASEIKDMAMRVWIIFMTIFQMAPFVRYIDDLAINKGSDALTSLKFHTKRNEFSRKIWLKIYGFTDEMDEIAKATRMRVAEALTEAAPQCCLQLYIMALRGQDVSLSTVIIQGLSIGSSLVSISWTICAWDRENDCITLNKEDYSEDSLDDGHSHHQDDGHNDRQDNGCNNHQAEGRGNRLEESNENIQVTFIALIPMLLSNILMISSRVICISMFASHFREWIFLLLGLHVLVMFVFNFIIYKKHGKDVNLESPSSNLAIYNIRMLGISLFQIFAELRYNFKCDKSAYRKLHMTFHGVLILGENLGMIFAWYGNVEMFDHSTKLTILLCTLIPMVIGVFLSEMYYHYIYPHDDQEKTCCIC